MRDLTELNRWRDRGETVRQYYGSTGDAGNGVFLFQHRGEPMLVVASDGNGWDHVSVSFQRRTPTWEEMEWVAQRFFKDDEAAMQLHVPAADHVNFHGHTLHWWRPQGDDDLIPRPPSNLVGPKTVMVN